MLNPTRATRLIDDLIRLGNSGEWDVPIQKENIDWFAQYGSLRDIYCNTNLIIKRIDELVHAGADLTGKAYAFSNVNNEVLLNKAFEYGANPNIPGSIGLLPIERALNRGRFTIVDMLINHPDFDLNQTGRYKQNILFMAVESNKFKMALKIFDINPKFSLSKDMDNSSILMATAYKIKDKEKLTPNIKKFIKLCLDYSSTVNSEFSISEINKKGDSIFSIAPILAQIIMERNVLDLNENLSKTDEVTKKIFKL